MSFDSVLLLSSFFLIVSVVASKASDKLGFPSLLLFLVLGMLAGSEGPGGIYFDNASIAQSLGVVALVYILFYGGMDTDWKTIRPVMRQGVSLATVGVLLTSILVAAFTVYFLNFSWIQGLLFGSIVSSTDAAAVFAIMRSKGVSLKGDLRPLIELESGSNDPMAIFLTMSLVALIGLPEASYTSMFVMFLQQMTLGSIAGLVGGRLLTFILNRIKLGYDGLYPVLSIAVVMMIYAATANIGGNGFLAVYLAGLIAGNRRLVHKKSLIHFHDGIAWLMQIIMFFVLGLLVFPSQLVPVAKTGFLVAGFLILIARPIAIFLTLSPFGFGLREKIFISWVGLRGAAPIILATFPLLAETPQANVIFNMVFFVVLTSIVIQGTSISRAAKLLKLDLPTIEKIRSPLELDSSSGVINELVTLSVTEGSRAAKKQVMDLSLPEDTLIVLAGQPHSLSAPSGRTVLHTGDRVLVFTRKEHVEALRREFET